MLAKTMIMEGYEAGQCFAGHLTIGSLCFQLTRSAALTAVCEPMDEGGRL
jgi:hypothetical protein